MSRKQLGISTGKGFNNNIENRLKTLEPNVIHTTINGDNGAEVELLEGNTYLFYVDKGTYIVHIPYLNDETDDETVTELEIKSNLCRMNDSSRNQYVFVHWKSSTASDNTKIYLMCEKSDTDRTYMRRTSTAEVKIIKIGSVSDAKNATGKDEQGAGDSGSGDVTLE